MWGNFHSNPWFSRSLGSFPSAFRLLGFSRSISHYWRYWKLHFFTGWIEISLTTYAQRFFLEPSFKTRYAYYSYFTAGFFPWQYSNIFVDNSTKIASVLRLYGFRGSRMSNLRTRQTKWGSPQSGYQARHRIPVC
jgi:hypothetical protein